MGKKIENNFYFDSGTTNAIIYLAVTLIFSITFIITFIILW